MATYIVYACPVGELADQIQHFFDQSRERFGANAAHQYMPHCTLTGFFEDRPEAMPIYSQAIDQAYRRALAAQSSPVITVKGLSFQPEWYGLEIESSWLKRLMVNFARTTPSPTRKAALRLKTWLHLSLAYDFAPQHSQSLGALAKELVDPTTEVQWQLRFYQREPSGKWICHYSWPLEPA
ncbi:hypothetical protein C7271_01085 [filamentous cyanobacterium CCP5]|nr:hypothetical protein C7271_01085 [filamentous cyanobacterium CCP5]